MTKSPNILWICTDQQRWDTIGALGNPHVDTPNVDRLVREGVAFTHAYCQSPICTPSRASFLTGCYPSTVHNARNGNESVPPSPPLVTKMLADAGYDCGLIGKLHLSSAYGRIEARQQDADGNIIDGYRYWQYSHAPRDDWPQGHDYADWVRSKGHVLGELTQSHDGVPAELHQTTWCAEKTIDFMRQEREGPWLASVNIYDPHPPFNPPRRYRDQFDPATMPGPLFRESDLAQQAALAGVDFQSKVRRPQQITTRNPLSGDIHAIQAAYYAMIKLIDDQVGRMIDALEESGQRENTIIIFMSDHGETLGDHGLLQKGCRFYEGLVRVPLIWSWPGQIEQNVQSDALVELTDIAPTLLGLAEQPIPDYMQGRSLQPILTGDAIDGHQTAAHRDFVRSEYFDTLDEPNHSYGTMYRDARYKLVVYHGHYVDGHGLGELYDLQNDPGEFENLWDDSAHQSLKLALMRRSFDASMFAAVDVGSRRMGPM